MDDFIMKPKSLDRINELAKLSRERELTADELAEQKTLRDEYIAGYRNSLKSHLDSMVIVDEKGKRHNVSDRIKK